MTQAPEQAISGLSDTALIEAVRQGSSDAFGMLYQRHHVAARRASTYLAKSEAEREDVVAEAFARILRVLQAGKGPTEEFRPYLLRTMRNIAINTTRQQSPLSPVADMTVFDSPEDAEDPATAEFDRQLITRAFTSLPERWRTVLWHTEVEGENPAAVAPLLGMSPNGVAALAYRAREGLSRAYLQMHLPTEDRLDCRASRAKLGGFVRKSLTDAEMRKVGDHLDNCDRCRALAAGLIEINNDLRAILAPLVLGIPLATAYLGKSAAAGTVATAKATSISAKTASVGSHVIAKVALVIAAAVALGGAASYPHPAEARAAAPAVPQVDAAPRATEPHTPPVPPASPEPAPPPATTTPPATETSESPAPAADQERDEPAAEPAGASNAPEIPPVTAPPTTSENPPRTPDHCRAHGPACDRSRSSAGAAPPGQQRRPTTRTGHGR